MGREKQAKKALILLRSRLCNPCFIFKPLSDSPESNYSKLKFILSSSVTEACNNSILLLGPRGSGKAAVLELVLNDLLQEYLDTISVIRLNGLLHNDDNCAFKASFDENSQFIISMLRECGLAHKTIIFVLDEFDLFAQGKQRLLYSLLDAMQSVTSQAVVIGISCRLDADQLLEKRVRSRFSHRKLLFLPPSEEDLDRLFENILYLPTDTDFPCEYTDEFNEKLKNILMDGRFRDIIHTYLNSNSTINNLLRFLFLAVSYMDMESGLLSLDNFKTAFSSMQRQPKMESIKEYKSIHDSFQTSDHYSQDVCLRAFENLLQRQLICFADNRGYGQSLEFRPVKLLILHAELHQGMKSYRSCPAVLLKLMDR